MKKLKHVVYLWNYEWSLCIFFIWQNITEFVAFMNIMHIQYLWLCIVKMFLK